MNPDAPWACQECSTGQIVERSDQIEPSSSQHRNRSFPCCPGVRPPAKWGARGGGAMAYRQLTANRDASASIFRSSGGRNWLRARRCKPSATRLVLSYCQTGVTAGGLARSE